MCSKLRLYAGRLLLVAQKAYYISKWAGIIGESRNRHDFSIFEVQLVSYVKFLFF